MSESVHFLQNAMDSIPADKVWKWRNWICKDVSRYTMRVPNAWRSFFLLFGIPMNRQSIPPGIRLGGKDTGWPVTLECPLRAYSASWKSIESFMQMISFCNSCVLSVSSKIVSPSSVNLLLAIVSKVELWNFFNSSISVKLFRWASRNFEFGCNICSWKSCWSRRWNFSAWVRWNSTRSFSLDFCAPLRSSSFWNGRFWISFWQSGRICSFCRIKQILICAFSGFFLVLFQQRIASFYHGFLLLFQQRVAPFYHDFLSLFHQRVAALYRTLTTTNQQTCLLAGRMNFFLICVEEHLTYLRHRHDRLPRGIIARGIVVRSWTLWKTQHKFPSR